MREQAWRIQALGPARVLLKGGHLAGPRAIDVLVGPDGTTTFEAERVVTDNTHGTGCTLSAAIAVLQARRPDWEASVRQAKTYLTGALRAAQQLDVGHGHGPVHHFYDLWPPEET
jgi:hydroxymethylpyrimidine/phosphomethylpyrimidine kinase